MLLRANILHPALHLSGPPFGTFRKLGKPYSGVLIINKDPTI